MATVSLRLCKKQALSTPSIEYSRYAYLCDPNTNYNPKRNPHLFFPLYMFSVYFSPKEQASLYADACSVLILYFGLYHVNRVTEISRIDILEKPNLTLPANRRCHSRQQVSPSAVGYQKLLWDCAQKKGRSTIRADIWKHSLTLLLINYYFRTLHIVRVVAVRMCT